MNMVGPYTTLTTAEAQALRHVARLAGEIAIMTPDRRNPHSYYAYVPWMLINELRTTLNELGIDWIATQRHMHKIAREQKKSAKGG